MENKEHEVIDMELDEYYEAVIRCLVYYGELSEIEARNLTNESGLLIVYDDIDAEIDRSLIFHEYPYYWAMSILYGKTNGYWHNDPDLWPPPDNHLKISSGISTGQ